MRRGLILNLISNIMFFISGYVLHFFLGRSMPPTEYGVVGTILTVLDFEYMFASNGARQSLASHISGGEYDPLDVIKKTVGFQLAIIALFFCIDFFGAPLFGLVFNDASLSFYFRIAGILVVVNGLEVILLGINDGLQRFGTSALLGTFYSVAKLGTIPLILTSFAYDPVLGVEIGFIAAVVATIVLGLILLFIRPGSLANKAAKRISFSQIAHRTLSFSVFFIVVSLVLSFDTLIVKAVVEPPAMAGYYTGAVNFGKIVYYLLQAFSTVILPIVSSLVVKGHIIEARSRIHNVCLVSLAFILPISVVISASSGNLLSVFYGQEYSQAAWSLSFLTFSNYFMGMTVLLNMVLNASSSSRFSDVLSIGSLCVVIPVFVFAAQWGGIRAISTASACCTATMMLLSFHRVRSSFGPVLEMVGFRLIIANIALWLVIKIIVSFFPYLNLIAVLVMYILIYFIFILILVFTKQIDMKKILESIK